MFNSLHLGFIGAGKTIKHLRFVKGPPDETHLRIRDFLAVLETRCWLWEFSIPWSGCCLFESLPISILNFNINLLIITSEFENAKHITDFSNSSSTCVVCKVSDRQILICGWNIVRKQYNVWRFHVNTNHFTLQNFELFKMPKVLKSRNGLFSSSGKNL